MHKQSLLATFYFALAVLLQATTDNFPLSFAFPFNVIWIMAWGYLLWHLYREGSQTNIIPFFLLASHTRILSISILIGGSPIIGSFPQLSDVDVAFMSGDL